LCNQYVAAGGEIHWYPELFSGIVLRERVKLLERARRKSIAGWLARFGLNRIPDEALPFVMESRLSVPAARVGLIWVAARDREPVRIATIAERVHLDPKGCRRTAIILVAAGRMTVASEPSGARYLSLGDTEPDWREFMRAA
jgi:hypothetical protein